MPGPGFLIGPKLAEEHQAQISFGFRIAKEISRLEIGQTVVIKDGAVLAVEAFEGTDACLKRGGELAGPGGGAVAVKVAKERHDMRFDIPCIGPKTLECCAQARLAALALEADKTLLLEREQIAELAHRHQITLLTVEGTLSPR